MLYEPLKWYDSVSIALRYDAISSYYDILIQDCDARDWDYDLINEWFNERKKAIGSFLKSKKKMEEKQTNLSKFFRNFLLHDRWAQESLLINVLHRCEETRERET